MNNWVAGKGTTPARVDPTIGAIVIAVVDILVMFNVHTKLGVSENDLLQVGLHVGTILLALRSVQLNVVGRKGKAAAPAVPAETPPDEPTPPEPHFDPPQT
jgi:hypothetical protein